MAKLLAGPVQKIGIFLNIFHFFFLSQYGKSGFRMAGGGSGFAVRIKKVLEGQLALLATDTQYHYLSDVVDL